MGNVKNQRGLNELSLIDWSFKYYKMGLVLSSYTYIIDQDGVHCSYFIIIFFIKFGVRLNEYLNI